MADDPIGLAAFLAVLFGVAALYASVGHAGASGYLAIMALVGAAPAVMKPTALLLNLVVAGVGTWRFAAAGLVSWRTLLRFGILSVPCAFAGALLSMPDAVYRVVLGAVLVVGAARLAWTARAAEGETRAPPWVLALLTGALIGLLSGAIGIGGGVLLTPIVVLARWTTTREAAGLSAAFILVNSAAGMAGELTRGPALAEELPWMVAIVFCGGLVGSELGAIHLAPAWLRRVLALVLLIASAKLILAAAG